MAVGGNNKSLSDFLCHILTALPMQFSKNPKSIYIIPQCLLCISEKNPRDNSPCWYFFLRAGSFSDQPWVTMMNGSQTECPKIWRFIAENLGKSQWSLRQLCPHTLHRLQPGMGRGSTAGTHWSWWCPLLALLLCLDRSHQQQSSLGRAFADKCWHLFPQE